MPSLNQILSQPVTSLFDKATMVLSVVWNALLWYKTLFLQNAAFPNFVYQLANIHNENTVNKDKDSQKDLLVFVLRVPYPLVFLR